MCSRGTLLWHCSGRLVGHCAPLQTQTDQSSYFARRLPGRRRSPLSCRSQDHTLESPRGHLGLDCESCQTFHSLSCIYSTFCPLGSMPGKASCHICTSLLPLLHSSECSGAYTQSLQGSHCTTQTLKRKVLWECSEYPSFIIPCMGHFGPVFRCHKNSGVAHR